MPGNESSDRDLLWHYVQDRDPVAFRELVSRHGPAVHRVCRGVLADAHEAEDAFQATFLLLARKAPGIRDPESLGGWLRGVAYRVAIRARRQAARRRVCERTWGERSRFESSGAAEGPDFELGQIVGDELARLPDNYRRPIMLCYLDGLTHQEAARRMACPVGTVKVRLVRGRRLLRERLHRRGVALGASLLVILRPGRGGAAAVTERLAESTVRAMSLEMSGRRTVLEHAYPRASELADRAGRFGPIGWPRWLWAAAIVAAVSLALSGPVARVLGGPPEPEVDPSTLPHNLTDVLNVECR